MGTGTTDRQGMVQAADEVGKGKYLCDCQNIPLLFERSARNIRFDILYFLSIYFLLLTSLLTSDLLLVLHALGYVTTTIVGFSSFLWVLAITLFVVGTFITLVTEKGEMKLSNIWIIFLLMYVSYCQMWMIVAIPLLFSCTWLNDSSWRCWNFFLHRLPANE